MAASASDVLTRLQLPYDFNNWIKSVFQTEAERAEWISNGVEDWYLSQLSCIERDYNTLYYSYKNYNMPMPESVITQLQTLAASVPGKPLAQDVLHHSEDNAIERGLALTAQCEEGDCILISYRIEGDTIYFSNLVKYEGVMKYEKDHCPIDWFNYPCFVYDFTNYRDIYKKK